MNHNNNINNLSPSLKNIFFALIYEGFLILSVTFIALIIAGIIIYLLNNYPTKIKELIVSIIIILAWGIYSLANWCHGQTLAMKTWNISLVDHNNNIPSLKKLLLRFIWAVIFIVFIPLLIYFLYKTHGNSPKTSFILAIFWWILPWGFTVFNSQRKFIYDQLAGTKLINSKKLIQ